MTVGEPKRCKELGATPSAISDRESDAARRSAAHAFDGRWPGWGAARSTLRDSNGNANLFGLNRNDDEDDVNAYNGNPDNEWNANVAFVVLQQLPLSLAADFRRRVLFLRFAEPAAEHAASRG